MILYVSTRDLQTFYCFRYPEVQILLICHFQDKLQITPRFLLVPSSNVRNRSRYKIILSCTVDTKEPRIKTLNTSLFSQMIAVKRNGNSVQIYRQRNGF